MLKRSYKIIIFLSFFCLNITVFCSLTIAQKKSIKIISVSVVGNQTTDANIILMTAGLTEGSEISGDQIQKSIKQLWGLGIFSDIQLRVERQVGDNYYLRLELTEHPRVESYSFEGNKKIKERDLQEALNLYPGQIYNPSKIVKNENTILKLYEEKGFLLTSVAADTNKSDKPNRVKLVFNIDEGQKVNIKKISFTGNTNFDDGKLKKQLKDTKENKWWWFGGDFKKKEYEEDKDRLLAFYRKNGFRDVEIVKDSIYYDETRENLFIDITVQEGVRYRIRKITWEGNELFDTVLLSNLLNIKEGDYYNQEELQKAVTDKLSSIYYDYGYIFTQVVPQEIPVGQDQLDIKFIIHEGDPVTVRKILVEGNTKTKEKVIRRELRILPGDVFSRAALMRSHREIFIMNYFSNVIPDVRTVNQEQVDILFTVEEKSTDQANMSAGWSERDRLIGSLGVGMNNLFGNGQRLNFDWTFGRYFRNFQIGFTEPWLFDTPTLAGISLYDSKRDNSIFYGYKQTSRGGTFRVGRRMRWPDNYFRSDFIYRIDQTSLSDFSERIAELNPNGIATENWPLTSSSITYALSRDSRDRAEFPTRGSEFSITNEFAGKVLGGNVEYHKHLFSFNGYYPFFWKLVLHTNTDVGYLDGFGSDSRIPYLELFFIGGAGLTRSTPLRGYDDPLSGNGGAALVSGGRTLLKQQLEIRMPFLDNPTAYGLVFAEAGNIWSNIGDTDPFDLKRSIGVGIRIFMPMLGLIGFDYAYGFDNFEDGKRFGAWKPHFVFGRGF